MGELVCWPDREVPSSAKRRRRASDHVHSTIAMAEARYEYKSGYGGGLKGTRTIAVGSGLHKLVVRPDPGGRRWVSCARVEFELHHLRLLCDAIAPTEKTKRIRQFVRSTPIPAGAQASDFASLGDALTLLAVHLGDVDCFAEVVSNISRVRDVRDGLVCGAQLQPRLLGYTSSWQRQYGACSSRGHSGGLAAREDHILEEYQDLACRGNMLHILEGCQSS